MGGSEELTEAASCSRFMRPPRPSTSMPTSTASSRAMGGLPRKSTRSFQASVDCGATTFASEEASMSATGSRMLNSAAPKDGRGLASTSSPRSSAVTYSSGTGT